MSAILAPTLSSGKARERLGTRMSHSMKARMRIAIACQRGGSQTAFTTGVLKALAEADLAEQFELVSISGRSGGAVRAVLMWNAFEKDERPVWGRLMRFWEDNTALNWLELTFNNLVVSSLCLTNIGFFPQFALGPTSPVRRVARPGRGALGARRPASRQRDRRADDVQFQLTRGEASCQEI